MGILNKSALRRTSLFVSTILAAGAAMPALSQTVSLPPERLTVDENGVSLAQRNLFLEVPELQIGGSGSGLVYSRIWVGDGWRNNFTLVVRDLITYVNVTIGSKTLKFNLVGGVYVPDGGNGETLTSTASTYTFTDRDGTIAIFDRSYNNRWFGQNVNALGTSMTLPSGEVITLTYKNFSGPVNTSSTRLQSVNSSTGFQVKFSYAASNSDVMTSAKVINNSVDYCNPSADSCSFTQSWPYMNYTTSTSPDGLTITETATDALGRTTRYTSRLVGLNAELRLTGIRRPSSVVDTSTFTYTNKAKLTSATVEGVTWQYTGGTVGGVTTATRTNPLAQVRTATFNAATGTLATYKDELNRTTNFTYDASNRLDRVTAPEGNYVTYGYDARGNVTTTTAVSKTPGTPANIVTTATFPASCTNPKTCNSPTSTTDARGNVTDYTYDPTHGGVLTVTLPAPVAGGIRPQKRYAYTPLQAYYKNSGGSIVASGLPLYKLTSESQCMTTASCTGGADESKTVTSYGPQTAGVANNLLPVSSSSGSGDGVLTATTTATYDTMGNRLAIDGPLPGTADTTRYRYDAGRQLVGVIGPDPDGAGALLHAAQRTTYNVDGRVTQSEIGTVTDQSDAAWAAFSSQQQVATSYDTNARPVKQELKSGGTTYSLSQTSYDAIGRVECAAQRMDPAQWASQSVVCTPQTTGSNGPDRITKTVYDAAGQTTQVLTAYGTADQATEVTNTWSNNGKLASVKDGENNLTTYEYDGFDRVLKTRYPVPTQGSNASSATDYLQPTYDANGNVTQLRLRDGLLINYTYDNLDRLTFKDMPNYGYHEADVTYAYDLLGRMTGLSTPDGNYFNHTFDALGRATTEASWFGTKSMQYDLAGRMTRLTWPDAFYVTYDYDVTGNVTAIREIGAASGVGVLATYAYDNLGRRTSLTRGNGTTTSYSFDPVSRLSSLTQDLAGTAQDLTVNGFAYNPAGQIGALTRSNDAYAWGGHYNVNRNYAINGLNQMTAAGATGIGYDGRGNLTSSGASTYQYTSDNRLATTGSGVYLANDGAGRLVQVYANGGANVTPMDYLGQTLISEFNGSNQLIRRYVHGPGEDEPIVWYEGSGTADRRWLHTDERGSVIAVSNASGSSIATNTYDEYGIPAASNLGRFGYTGQTWLSELGMWYYKARMYSPTLGRFMQTDPIGYADGINWYNYVGSDPINATDPSGLCTGTRICPDSNRNGSSGGGSPVAVFDFGHFKRVGSGTSPADRQNSDEIVATSLYVWVRDSIIPFGEGTWGQLQLAKSAQNDSCEKRSSDGTCILRRNAAGKLELTDEWEKKICASVADMQATSGVINDTVGFPGTTAGAAAAGAEAARRAGAGAKGSARAGTAMGLYGWLVGLIAQTTTGQGWKPFGITVVPKVDLSMCEK